VTAKACKRRSPAEGSPTTPAEDFLADLYRYWQQHGRGILDHLSDERPEVVFKLLVKLAVVLHRALGKPRDFDRRRIREEALQRLGVSTIELAA
jgi:hypothetical protein